MINVRKWLDESGQALVEFSIIFALFVAVLFGIIQFAFFLGSHILVASAAREGVRLAAVGAEEEAVLDRAEAITSLIPLLSVEREDIEVSPSSLTERQTDQLVTVTVLGRLNTIMPFIASDSTLNIVHQAQMQYELLGLARPRLDGYIYILELGIKEIDGQGTNVDYEISFNVVDYLTEGLIGAEVTIEILDEDNKLIDNGKQTKETKESDEGGISFTFTGLNKNNDYFFRISDIEYEPLIWEGGNEILPLE